MRELRFKQTISFAQEKENRRGIKQIVTVVRCDFDFL